jgi:hypothetical protein
LEDIPFNLGVVTKKGEEQAFTSTKTLPYFLRGAMQSVSGRYIYSLDLQEVNCKYKCIKFSVFVRYSFSKLFK